MESKRYRVYLCAHSTVQVVIMSSNTYNVYIQCITNYPKWNVGEQGSMAADVFKELKTRN